MKRVSVLACMVLLMPTLSLFAQPRGPMGKGMEKLAVDMLKLTSEQKKKFEDISTQFQKKMVDIQAAIQKNRIDLKNIISSENVDEKDLLKLTEETSKLQSEMKSNAVNRWIEINKLLDKDQKVEWAKMLNRIAMMDGNVRGRFNQFAVFEGMMEQPGGMMRKKGMPGRVGIMGQRGMMRNGHGMMPQPDTEKPKVDDKKGNW